jgi:superfamily I DNA and/or RNA helicase
MERFTNILSVVFPVIISSPDTACSLYKMKRKEFDYVIFDEASQITLERSLPIVYLGDKIIISGDKQQLQPSDFFAARVKEEYEETYKEGEDDLIQNFEDIEDSESLLSFMEKKFHQTMLMYHYRSSKRELIQFSNAVFYKNKLIVSDSPKNNEPGIECIEVDGK